MGNIYRVSMLTEVHQVGCVNVMNWEDVSSGSNPDREEELRDFFSDPATAGNFAARWAAIMSSDATIRCMKIQKVSPAPEGTMKHYFVNHSGDLSGGAAPSNLALVIRLYTTTATRRGRGRHFFAGVDLGMLDGGQYSQSLITELGLFADVFGEGAVSADGTTFRTVVYSPTDDAYRDVAQAHYDPVPRNHRSRNGQLCGA